VGHPQAGIGDKRLEEDQLFAFSKFRSRDACIGAYTRAIRPHFKLNHFKDRQRFHILLEHIAAFNDMPVFVP